MTTSPDDVIDTLAIVRFLYDHDAEPVAKTQELIAEWQQLHGENAADDSALLPTVGVVLRALLSHAQPDVDSMFAAAGADALAKAAAAA